MKTKSQLRGHYKSMLIDLDHRTSVEERELLFVDTLKLFFKNQRGLWAAFQPMKTEPLLLKALQSISHIQFCFPRIAGNVLEFVKAEKFQISALGFLEPVGGKVFRLQDLQGLLIPGLAFDRNGHRLGRGKAFYDKTLIGCQAIKAAVCYHQQLHQENLPAEDHDVRMDFVITEKEIIPASQERNSTPWK